jgi:hypothetical protein
MEISFTSNLDYLKCMFFSLKNIQGVPKTIIWSFLAKNFQKFFLPK